MKSIQYPFMPEEGMIEPSELKIHQASHARYFEDFLKYVEYEQSMPEILHSQVLGLVARQGERYVILIEGDYLHIEKGVSPIELLRPDDLHAVIERITREEEEGH